MEAPATIFAIPTYRLRDVPETVERYDENFWLNGNEVALIVFDDSSLVNHHKYYAQLEATRTANPLYYVGPREKEQFIQVLLHRLREPKLEGPVRNLFRPSYGGNRNFTLMYSLGAFLVSSDDDMRPSALIEHSPESLAPDEICRGKLMKARAGGFEERSFDLLTAYLSIAFHYAGEVALEESEAILRKITAVHRRVLAAADRAHDPERALALRAFAANLAKSFYGFEPDFFQQNVSRIVEEVISQIRGSLELWPTLVEICYFRKDKAPLPRIHVRNQPRNNGKS